MRVRSTSTMIARLEGCLGTGDLSTWEEGFVQKLADIKNAGQVTALTEKQLDTLQGLFDRHFSA